MAVSDNQLSQLIDAVISSSKYRDIDLNLITSIGLQELEKRNSLKEAIKSTKKKLHQVGCAFFYKKINYDDWLNKLHGVSLADDPEEFLDTCKAIMGYHSSTKERLAILEPFYSTIFANLPEIHTILDIACGLNPVSIPWMPLAKDVEYYAYDIYQDMVDFLNKFMTLVNVRGYAHQADVIQNYPTHEVDVTFLLKALPCLEQSHKAMSAHILNIINSKYIVVSFPAHSLGGKNKGMVATYEAWFRELIKGNNWTIKRFEISTELVFIVKK